ncbi:MAG TPA: 50S ribosomal protein L10 [Candidatus Methylomirabilis sp.]|nr:50S ribosomal protein L10 [Candidatus Methylomirabilis sp.]HSB80776.1 50S ribosomal protein L10 [Candidatus Methylomirabilis sp.]HSC70737.1 50S ribosomal protein L10 [Candidatus Methylomirabilis sp.]
MARTEKATSIAELREKLGSARSAVLTDFRGLSVADLTELRTLLRKNAVEYAVVKNTLAKIAVKDTTLAGLSTYLEGPTAIAISRTDPVAASKILATWGKTRPTFTLKGGMVEGKIVGPAEISALGNLPPREILLARLLGAFQAPLQGLAQVLGATIRSLAVVLDQVRQHKERGA